MVHVQEVDLTAIDVRLPTSLVGMVVMQPFLRLTEVEPFRCRPDRKTEQLAAIERTLAIAEAGDHGAEKTHFTLIPEYSIPGLDGIARIETTLRSPSWHGGTFVIGGTDGLRKSEYATLCAESGTMVDVEHNGPDRVKDSEWVNCCITWVKTPNGDLRRWLQPKIRPNWDEQNIRHEHMFRGSSVFLFRSAFGDAAQCRFFSLVCYDWIAAVEDRTIPQHVLTFINAQGQEVSLSWIFVPQHNDKPSDPKFLAGVAEFFENQANWPLIHRHRCCVVFANTAGRETPGTATMNGCSGLILSPLSPFDLNGCHPTYCGKPKLLRVSGGLGRCQDVLFREKGACVQPVSARSRTSGRRWP